MKMTITQATTISQTEEPMKFEDARRTILDRMTPLETECSQLLDSLGRIVAEDVTTSIDLPRFDNSSMDGYAVRITDLLAEDSLRIGSHIVAGSPHCAPLPSGMAARIMTGAPVPANSDAVIPIEQASTRGDRLIVSEKHLVTAEQYIRRRGEDIRCGERVIPLGSTIGPAEICVLASLGKKVLRVYRRPKVAILATGDELVAPGSMLRESQVFDANSYALAAAVKEAGAIPVLLGIARDHRENLSEKLEHGLEHDALITAAGVSVGDRDLVRPVLRELGVKEEFWKVKMKPGRSFAFGVKGCRPVFSLPGNPVSALIAFEELVRPALLKMAGANEPVKKVLKAILQEQVTKSLGMKYILRVRVEYCDGVLKVRSAGKQSSGVLATTLHANALALLPEDRTTVAAGEQVEIQLI
jgi:molybdopterin molybdotransferase